MRVLLHDYSGHPFQVQLSRELARRGHHVLHLHCPSFATPKGSLALTPNDPPTLSIEGLPLRRAFAKYSPLRRFLQEARYGRILAERVSEFRPDVIISSNTPLVAQKVFLRRTRKLQARFIFWQQDIYSVAMGNLARRKLGVLGAPLGRAFTALERSMVTESDAVIVISHDFATVLDE